LALAAGLELIKKIKKKKGDTFLWGILPLFISEFEKNSDWEIRGYYGEIVW